MEQFLTLTKKYGVTGVLAMWLWHTDSRLTKVETELYDCYKAKVAQITQKSPELNQLFAILVDKPKMVKKKKGEA